VRFSERTHCPFSVPTRKGQFFMFNNNYMIKKELQLVPIPRWLKKFKAGHWIQNKKTKQFGTITREDLRGKYARRDLLHNFNPVIFYLVDKGSNNYIASSEVLFTYKDGSIIRGVADSMPQDTDLVSIDPIILSQAQIMTSWVTIGSGNPHILFSNLSPTTIGEIMLRGGKVWLEMERISKYNQGFLQSIGISDPTETEATVEAPLLDEGKFIIHLTP
jgi:hypothetical protein